MKRLFGLAALLLFLVTSPTAAQYTELEAVFTQWPGVYAPPMVDGVPDYSSGAMDARLEDLGQLRERHARIDTSGWSIPQQVDWYLMLSQLNGLAFEHRVKQSWKNDPNFYVWYYPNLTDVPEREAEQIHGNIQAAYMPDELTEEQADNLAQRLAVMPRLYAQARRNLTGNKRDLWRKGIGTIRSQSSTLQALATSSPHEKVRSAALAGSQASDELAAWLEEQLPSKTGVSGIGKDEYTWNMQRVHLLPYSWEDEVRLLERELARSHSALRLEEHRNRRLPKLTKIDNAQEYARRFNDAIDEYLAFLENEDIIEVKPYFDTALRARVNEFVPNDGIRGFFSEITYREPLVMRTHDYHWIELQRLKQEPYANPMRQRPLAFNAFDSRAEGMATAMEELMMHTGVFDARPRARELVWILLAQRAARGLGNLYQHGLEMDLQEAADFSSKWTPWGLLPADGRTIQGEQHFYIRQPPYGSSYVTGKIMIDQLIAEWARQRDTNFVMSEFMEAFNACGIIPMSLIYWEMTGDKSMVEKALGLE